MTDLRIDPDTGDIDLSNGMLHLVEGDEAIAQNILIRCRMFFGEWFLDERQGVPYVRDVFVKNPDIDLVRAVFHELLRTTAGVTRIISLVVDVDPITRMLDGRFKVTTVDGGVIDSADFNPFILDA